MKWFKRKKKVPSMDDDTLQPGHPMYEFLMGAMQNDKPTVGRVVYHDDGTWEVVPE